jgi:uncharacterized delta-60 repeat protein
VNDPSTQPGWAAAAVATAIPFHLSSKTDVVKAKGEPIMTPLVPGIRTLRAAGCAALLASVAGVAAALEGALDTRFYYDGKYTLTPTAGNQEITALVEAPDGRLVAAGYRSTSNGHGTLFWTSLDGFTSPVICSPDTVAGGLFGGARGIAFDGAGRLLVVGSATSPQSGYQGVVLRYLYPDCALDPTFNVDGVYQSSCPSTAVFSGVAVDSAGRIVLAGYRGSMPDTTVIVERLTPSGLYDFSFGGDGRVELGQLAYARAEALAIQPDDRIVLAGLEGFSDGLVVRLDPIGDLDGTFSGDGMIEVDFHGSDDIFTAIQLDPVDGGMLAAGDALDAAGVKAAVARLRPNGTLDTAFGGGDGKWSAGVGNNTHIGGIALQGDGRILIGGSFEGPDLDYDFLVIRLTPTGLTDGSFGAFGGSAIAFDLGGSLHDAALDVSLHRGMVAIAGGAATSSTRVGAVVRLWLAHVFSDGFESGSPSAWSGQAGE